MGEIEIILPCYNEESNLPDIVDDIMTLELFSYGKPCILVVDDGSTDGTAECCERLREKYVDNFRYVVHKTNQGKECAIYTGLSNSIADFIVVMDADYQDSILTLYDLAYTLQITPRLDAVAVISENPCSPLHSMFYPIFSKLTGVNIPTNVRDMRIMRRSVVDDMLYDYKYFFKAELERRHIKIGYIRCYTATRRNGSSTFNFIKYCIYAIKAIIPYSKSIALKLLTCYIQLIIIAIMFRGDFFAQDVFIFISAMNRERRLVNEITTSKKIYSIRK